MTVAAIAVQHSVNPAACEQSETSTDNIFAPVWAGEQESLNSQWYGLDSQEVNDEFQYNTKVHLLSPFYL